MKELYGGMLLIAAFVVVAGSELGRNESGPRVSRADMWNDLRGRQTSPSNNGAHFTTVRTAPLKGRSPEALAEPALAFAEEMTTRAADISRHMRGEMGLPALVAGAASALVEDEEVGEEVAGAIGISPAIFAAIDPFSSPQRSGPGELAGAGLLGAALTYAPLPVPRPAPGERTTPEQAAALEAEAPKGIIASAIAALTSAGRSAISEEEATQRKVVILVSPDAPDPAQPRSASYQDRADLPGLNPGPPREPFTELNEVYRDRAPGKADRT
ncbi:hypothetical protein ACQ5SO_11245 [Rhodovulum sp. DZ06]|uniref:hypothetical protein n=1 Tax=Rhodovulum sp. DZ06 TaxID=3425126 RepID=UPI003D3307BC